MENQKVETHTKLGNSGEAWQCRESYYRTKWLMAHNRLHDVVHKPGLTKPEALAKHFEEYLAELRTAEEVASRPAWNT